MALGRKTGGRQKGTPNKQTMDVVKLLEEKFPGYNPVVAMAQMAHDTNLTPELRLAAHREAAKYVAPQRKAVEVTGEVNGSVKLIDLTGQ